jgi:glutaredoxin 3
MTHIEIYTKDWCGYSQRAKALLNANNLDFDEIDVTHDALGEREMIQRSGRTSVPQIFIDGIHVGGADELFALDASGELDLLVGRHISSSVDAVRDAALG